MTRFVIDPKKKQIRVNSQIISRNSTIQFFTKLYSIYPSPQTFMIKDLKLKYKVSEKTIRTYVNTLIHFQVIVLRLDYKEKKPFHYSINPMYKKEKIIEIIERNFNYYQDS